MKKGWVRAHINGLVFSVFLLSFLLLEGFGQIIERGVGNYLKWQNHRRPQLGRIWEKDRQNIVAQRKIESILSSLNTQEEASESIDSFKLLFLDLGPVSSHLISREKFLNLYYNFPGQWPRRIISPYELLKIDSGKKWDRVILSRSGPWITLSFIGPDNLPITEKYFSIEILDEWESDRALQRGKLEEMGFKEDRIYSIDDFFPVLQTLDPSSKSLFPDPRWFLSKGYHVTRVGISELTDSGDPFQPIRFGIECQTEYFFEVLLLPVPMEIASNVLSQIERSDSGSLGNSPQVDDRI